MKICIIGCSGHVSYVLEGFKKLDPAQVALTAAAPGSPGESMDPLYRALENEGVPIQAYSDYRRMLDVEKPDIAVVDCYFGDHGAISMEALRRGIHVFSEKPAANSLLELEELIDIYRQSGVSFSAMMGLRYAPWFQAAKKAVEEGTIGEVRLMNAQKSYRLGSRADFFKDRRTYGGTIPWVGSHAIDWLYWLGGGKFKSVYASHSRMHNRNHGDLEVTALCQFTMTSEVLGSVTIDYLRPDQAPTHDDDRIRVAGTRGVLEVRESKVYLVNDEADGIRELPQVQGPQIFEDFVRQVQGKGACLVSAEDVFAVTEACLRARLSADEGRVVNF
jgi:predicted dehydrogenase